MIYDEQDHTWSDDLSEKPNTTSLRMLEDLGGEADTMGGDKQLVDLAAVNSRFPVVP